MPPLPPRSTPAHILDHALVAASTIQGISDNSGAPFTNAIAALTSSILTMMQSIKTNRDQYFRMLEKIYVVLSAIIDLILNSDSLPPATLYHIGDFAETLQKIHASLEDQRDHSRIRQFLRRNEISAQLEICNIGLQTALEAFGVQLGMSVLSDLGKMQRNAQEQHENLLAFIDAQRDMFDSDSSRSLDGNSLSSRGNSSSSFSLLPAQPKIFNGRESELQDVVDMLEEYARIAILGPGGMGKTSLATAALHHPRVSAKYSSRLFFPCDSAMTSVDLIALIGSHLGLEPRRNLAQVIIRYFMAASTTLAIFDNLETSWEPGASRADVEEFLSLLADVPHLSLTITMRGAERPGRVRWTRPFLEPLKPLAHAASRQTFIDIADDVHDDREVEQLLRLADNLPLAVSLLANAADYEGCPTVLSRWEKENTTFLSRGSDRRSSLDASMALSVSSPRMTSGARELLSLLSLLPDGLSDAELLQWEVPISDILTCKATLLRTSLAYIDRDQRLKTLVPVQEYVQHTHPPAPMLVQPLQKYINQLLSLYKKFDGLSSGDLAPRITSNLGNIQSILARSLVDDDPDLLATIRSIMSLSSFNRVIGRRRTPLIERVSDILSRVEDHQLRSILATEVICSWMVAPIQNVDDWIMRGRESLVKANDPSQEALQFYDIAFKFADKLVDGVLQGTVRDSLAMVQWSVGNYSHGRQLAHEAVQCARIKSDLHLEAVATRTEAMCCAGLGDFSHSAYLCARSRELLALCGLRGGTVNLLVSITEADVLLRKTEYAESRKIYAAMAREISPEHSPYEYAIALLNLATLDINMGASANTIRQNLNSAKAIVEGQSPSMCFSCDATLADLELRKGHPGTAKPTLERCARDFYGNEEGSIFCLERLADLAHGMDSIYSTTRWAAVLLGVSLKSRNRLAIHKGLRCLGDIFLAQGDIETAARLFDVALQGFKEMDVHRCQGDCLLRLGDIFKGYGDEERAVEFWKAARLKFERSLQVKDVARVASRLRAVANPDM